MDCLNCDTDDRRKTKRKKISYALAYKKKETSICANFAQRKGRPNMNTVLFICNINAVKKAVNVIAERMLLQLEAWSTQVMFKQFSRCVEWRERRCRCCARFARLARLIRC